MNDNSQLDSVDRQKLLQDTPHQEGEWTQIGKAEVTLTIFGKAKVHVIRKHDSARRAWMIAGISLAVIAALVAAYMLGGEDAPAPVEPVARLSNQAQPAVINAPSVAALVAPVVVAAPPVVQSQPRTVVRVAPKPVTASTAASEVAVANPVERPASAVKPKPVLIDSVPAKPAAIAPPVLVSPILSPELRTVPAQPQGDITY